VGGYWDAKIPMFFPNFKGYMSEQIAKNMKSDGSFKSKAATKLSVDEVTHADNFAFKGTAPTIDETLKEKGVPPFGFGDMVSAALHDYDNKNGVVATVDGQTVTLYGDGSIMSPDGQPLAKGASTKALAVKAVQVSVEDVRKAYQAGKQGQDSANVVNGFKDEKGFFAAERMIPQVVPDADPAQIHKTIKWDYDSVDGLMADGRAADALALTGRLKARELAAIGDSLDAKFKKDAFKAGVVDPLVSDPLAFLKQVINYVPNTGGGIGGHNTDDEAMDYLASARATPGGIASLSVEQKRKIIMDVVSGYTSGSEEAGILEVLGAKREDAPALIDSVGWHRLWKAIDGAHCRAFVEQFGPDYWSARSLGDKEAEVKFLADGRTNDLAQETIIVILRTCSPADVRRIDDEVGGRLGLKWDLTGKWDTEFKRMKAGG
jgi:hypothetical protein